MGFIKICGITRQRDAADAVDLGASALGFVFWPASPRHIAPRRAAEIIRALPPEVIRVGVFVNEPAEAIRAVMASTGIGVVQLHGEEPAHYAVALACPILRALPVDDAEAGCAGWPSDTAFLLDAADPVRRGGTGRLVDWQRAASIARRHRVVLAGGLTDANVADAIAVVRPFGVDVSSGVEEAPGVKSAEKMARFLARARSAFEEQQVDRR